jgi:hypothetical protein
LIVWKAWVPALLLLTGCASAPQGESFAFAILGDAPYDEATYTRYERLIDDVNGHADLEWVIHVGDFKGGIESCSDAFFQARLDLNRGFEAPFVLTPGDNDWYDCVREAAGGYDDYERLDALRRIFYPETGAAAIARARPQSESEGFSDYVENVVWQRGGVTFATLHLLGPTRPPSDPDRAARDVAAATAWLEEVFDQATAEEAAGVFIAMQVDPWVFTGNREISAALCAVCNRPRPGLEWFYPLLTDRVVRFGRPVIVAVGDTHMYRVDKPLYTEDGELVTNFTRLEVFGFPDVHWVRVEVDASTEQVFAFREQLVR